MLTPPPTIVSVSDSESYLKWAARLLSGSGTEGPASAHGLQRGQLWLLHNPILPSAAQIEAALAGSAFGPGDVRLLSFAEFPAALRALGDGGPDVVVGAATGPVVERVFAAAATLPRRPALISGLPGVGLPAREKGMRFRALGDAFIAHSYAEQAAYQEICRQLDLPTRILVNRLPLLRSTEPPRRRSQDEERRCLVFAPQAKVPAERAQREAILKALAGYAAAFPGHRVIVKVRALAGEQQTHHEEYAYPVLLAELERRGEIPAGRLEVAAGPLSDYLTADAALVTVSSTAALESIDAGLPTGIISEFGMNEELLTLAFRGSGMELSLAELAAGRIPFPHTRWLEDNYFHQQPEPLFAELERLAADSRAGRLAPLGSRLRASRFRMLRAEARLRAPKPVVRTYQAVAGTVRRLRAR
ncbi:DUF6716 putative glycosyltransferase [Sediminivirga luteola]|uniref:Uncharacterized protein n=1 Tax=Sediminivirga luteola TaxID=1774748 RepID=A0A8J2TY09_9MICO|nr:DUF6716 putative glycosyltransferase [Sediminivirga luteola]MCI2265768.1 hypothetical protein [Sediminivirga luteola]GGA14742.1 hypothetical protein GCM10011333_17150 [Sediminivirga luteola]